MLEKNTVVKMCMVSLVSRCLSHFGRRAAQKENKTASIFPLNGILLQGEVKTRVCGWRATESLKSSYLDVAHLPSGDGDCTSRIQDIVHHFFANPDLSNV